MSEIHYGKCEKCGYMGGLNNDLICLACVDEKRLLSKRVKLEIQSLTAQRDQLNEKLKEVCGFYGDKAFSPLCTDDLEDITENGYTYGRVIKEDREWCGKNEVGGKLARSIEQQRKEIMNED